MKLVDTNVLLYAVDEMSPDHDVAQRWLDAALRGPDTVGFAWIALIGFMRIMTSVGMKRQPLTFEEASAIVAFWLDQPAAIITHPSNRHFDLLRGILIRAGTAGNRVNDAHLAALAIESGAEVVSYDRDFARFEGVRWSVPTLR